MLQCVVERFLAPPGDVRKSAVLQSFGPNAPNAPSIPHRQATAWGRHEAGLSLHSHTCALFSLVCTMAVPIKNNRRSWLPWFKKDRTMDNNEATLWLSQFIGKNLRIHASDGRVFGGQMKCTDKVGHKVILHVDEISILLQCFWISRYISKIASDMHFVLIFTNNLSIH